MIILSYTTTFEKKTCTSGSAKSDRVRPYVRPDNNWFYQYDIKGDEALLAIGSLNCDLEGPKK